MNKKKRLITISCSILICVITVLTWVYSNSTSNAIIAKTEIIPMLNHNKIEIHYSIENNTKNDIVLRQCTFDSEIIENSHSFEGQTIIKGHSELKGTFNAYVKSNSSQKNISYDSNLISNIKFVFNKVNLMQNNTKPEIIEIIADE
ncbi:MAG: hypothetical protein IJ235_03395 [Eubacterium sp.]|nr:hypothetical protein [Eubacterium sp.]MBQ8981743.1 hypothetical protein [Eubacterium sp.]